MDALARLHGLRGLGVIHHTDLIGKDPGCIDDDGTVDRMADTRFQIGEGDAVDNTLLLGQPSDFRIIENAGPMMSGRARQADS